MAKAVLLAAAVSAVSFGVAGQHPGFDLEPGPELEDAFCSSGEETADCELSLRQLRGDLRRSSADQLLSPEEPREEVGEGGSLGSHPHKTSSADFRGDAEAFLREHAGKPSCHLPRAGMAEVNRTWGSLLEAYLQQAGGLMPDERPWRFDRPYPDPGSTVGPLRDRFTREIFGGKAGVLEGVTAPWAAASLWANTSALVARLGPRRLMPKSFMFGRGAPVASNRLPPEMAHPPPETLEEYLARNESVRDFVFFVSEPIEEDWGSRAAVEAMQPDIAPLPVFAATAEEHHAIVAFDGVGASVGFHRHSAVWQTQVTGRKAWWLMPPEVTQVGAYGPPKVDGHVYDHRNACEFMFRRPLPPGAELCILEPGETMLLPEHWWHATCGLDEIAASVGGWLQDQRAGALLRDAKLRKPAE